VAKTPALIFDPRATTIPVLRYLVAVAEHGHFGRAAAACAVSQPTLSAQISQWEKRMKVQVFERSGSGAHATAIGERIISEARSLLQGLERLELAAVSLKAPFFGAVRLGVIPTVGPYLLPLIAPLIETSYPELDMPIRETQTGALLDLLDAGKVDVVLLAEVPDLAQGRTVARLYDEPFYVAVPKGHALALQERISAGDLANERMLLLDEGHCLRDQALEVCRLRDAEDRLGADWRATSLETLRQMVALRHGCTVLPALSIDQPHQEGSGIVARPLSGSRASRSIVMAWRASDQRSEAYRLLAGMIRKSLPRDRVRVHA